jgi:hypothetical protein
MTASLLIAPRFCGPPGVGNGGYVSGLAASYLDGPAEVTLCRPPPLARPLSVQRDQEGSVRVLDGNEVIAEATGVPRGTRFELPRPVSVPEAYAAGRRSPLRLQPGLHPFPACFVCGPQREPGDGLRICVGPAAGTAVWADVWLPGEEFGDAAGEIRPEFVWAALDCPGGVAAALDPAADGGPYVLGRLAARQFDAAKAGEPHVVVGWRLAARDRKILAGSALFTASGQAVAAARATWIRLRVTRPADTGSTP